MPTEFSAQRLSPVAVPPRPCDLPYDLTWDDLIPCLPGFDSRRAREARPFVAYEKQDPERRRTAAPADGPKPNSGPLTVRYPTVHGDFRTRTFFVKRASDPSSFEEDKYRSLAAHGIPTPELLAAVRRDGCEVLVLEFLPKIGIDFDSPSDTSKLLRLAARLHSIRDSSEVFRPRPGMPRDVYRARLRQDITTIVDDPYLHTELGVEEWLELYDSMGRAVDTMPKALQHWQFFFQQIGWSQSGLVIFDLESMALGPRFVDIATFLPALAEHTGRAEDDLFREYLHNLAEPPAFEDALRELRMWRVVGFCTSLNYALRVWPGSLPAGLARFHDDLRALGEVPARRRGHT